MKKLFTALASAVFLLVSASAFAGQPTPLTMQIDRTQDPSPVCLYRLTSGTCILIGTISSSGVWSPTAAILHVVNVDALKAFQNYDVSVRRDGFATPGDGGDATYVHQASACTITKNGKPGDDGAQVVDAAGTGCWLADLSKPISVKVWGAKIDDTTDDLAAWQAATTAMGAAQGDIATLSNTSGVLLFPGNNGTCSKLSGTLTILRSSLTIKGAGPHASCFDPQFATGPGVQFADSTHYLNNVRIEGVGFRSDVVHRTSGSSLQVWNTYFFNADDIGCYDYYYSCIGVDQTIAGNDYNFDRIFTGGTNGVTVGAGVYGFTIGAQSGSGSSCNPFCEGPTEVRINRSEIGQNGYGGTAGAAFNIQAVGGLYFFQTNTDFNYRSIWAHPQTGQLIGGLLGLHDNWDTQTAEAVLFDTTGGGKITSVSFRNEWVATCGQTSSGYSGIPCVTLQGPTDTIASVDMDFAPLIAAGGHGLVIGTGTDVRVSGHIAGNGLQNIGAYNGIVVAPPSGVTVKDLQIDARLGGSIGADGALPPNMQNCGLVVAAGGIVTNLIGRGDWSGNRGVASGICDNGSATDQLTHDYTNVFPASVPVLSGAGTSPSLSAGATDTRGTVTEGTSAAGFTLTFGRPTGNPRDCMISSPTGTVPTNYSVSTTALTLVNASGSGAKFTYVCR